MEPQIQQTSNLCAGWQKKRWYNCWCIRLYKTKLYTCRKFWLVCAWGYMYIWYSPLSEAVRNSSGYFRPKNTCTSDIHPYQKLYAVVLASFCMRLHVPQIIHLHSSFRLIFGVFSIFKLNLLMLQKLAAIPPSAFYSKENKHLGEKYLRFCFIKVGLYEFLHLWTGTCTCICDFTTNIYLIKWKFWKHA